MLTDVSIFPSFNQERDAKMDSHDNKMLNMVLNVQECDAREDDSSNAVGFTKII